MKKIALFLFVLFFVVGCDQHLTLQFESNGGSTVASMDLLTDTTPSEPAAPTKEGYRFGGWYLDSDFETLYTFDEPLTKSTTLYAKWEDPVYHIVFEDFDETIIYQTSFTAGTDLTDFTYPEDPLREGYHFEGWYNIIPDIMPEEDIVITAVYTKITGYEIALMVGPEGVDDGSINAMVWEAVGAFAEGAGISFRYYQATDQSLNTMVTLMDYAIEQGAQMVICPGYMYEVAVFEVQSVYPDVAFLLLDGYPHSEDFQDIYATENTISITFREEQAGFLAGYAAVMEGYRNLGFVGGMEIPAVVDYGHGFILGAEHAGQVLGLENDAITINYHYAGSFEVSPTLTTLMDEWYASGTEVIFAVAGGGIQSVITAAEMHEGAWVIEPDTMSYLSSNSVLTSAMKRFDNAVIMALTDFYDNQNQWPSYYHESWTVLLGVEADAVGLPTMEQYWHFENFTRDDYEDIIIEIATGAVWILVDFMYMPVTDIVNIVEIS